ncbi:hypothetical protein ACTXT7_010697 [Hymenolepis weldensis]
MSMQCKRTGKMRKHLSLIRYEREPEPGRNLNVGKTNLSRDLERKSQIMTDQRGRLESQGWIYRILTGDAIASRCLSIPGD